MTLAFDWRSLAVNGERLWRSLAEMARIGGTANGGVRRLAASDDDRRGRDLFAQWCRDAGLAVSVDEIGNLFARRGGADAAAPPVLIGSHLDTQPEGGRFDGAYGVLAALEVVRSLNDAAIVTRKPIEIASWTNEEGARFAPAMLGSAVAAGVMPLADALAVRDAAQATLADALDRIGYRGARKAARPAIDAYFEAHIEQGPVLEANRTEIGIVTGGQAIRWLDVTIAGQPAHAGTTPIAHRRDALFGFAQIADGIERMLADFAPHGLATIGCVGIPNASRNTIAGAVAFTLDLRHPDDATLDEMARAATEVCARVAAQRGLRIDASTHWTSPATPFDAACVASVEAAAERFGYRHERIVSGAGHDAIHLAKHCPSAMVFIPCVGGLSHNEAEDVLPDDATRGANVLLGAVLDRAGVMER
ncbi:Zn-dependent hydrolase [Burkholderia oklahomensis]|uniref:Zn-dependent hydrolase n=1 Tax=Burkholderia oklahomensis TaxID=342113 RepID=UPI00016A5A74|nr:Zn-dependent hydrolase [Burkholderia oklahomensis]AOI43127.1 Zn-dependent hydrolase [Burkholderia oklahomensis EO147]AOI46684.1 Zn-dependent hydrolase [Burkholderia oklahomensis C6786]KUY57854.1 Zn-dependent hydrolase [Burkholderia oklahomensis EO147]KUY62860.1 Zn-dependent hydrolase [Burkholderia oklahomensis C6786]MBI0360680.1 Zn-dependent hydrolase [Burkholderia oklahomensis]